MELEYGNGTGDRRIGIDELLFRDPYIGEHILQRVEAMIAISSFVGFAIPGGDRLVTVDFNLC